MVQYIKINSKILNNYLKGLYVVWEEVKVQNFNGDNIHEVIIQKSDTQCVFIPYLNKLVLLRGNWGPRKTAWS